MTSIDSTPDRDNDEVDSGQADDRSGSLWRHPDFVRLWVGQTVSMGGSLVGRFAVPLVAVLTLESGPSEVAALRVAGMLPAFFVALAAGAWIDRVRRRPLMIWTDLGRAALLVAIPLAAVLGALSLELLIVVSLAVGTLTTFFDVAYRSYLPSLVRREQLVEGNSKLAASSAVVEVASFGGAGWLVQLVTAPFAILLDALSFLVSAFALWRIRAPERSAAAEGQSSPVAEIREGLRFVLGSPVLRSLVVAAGLSGLFLHVWVSMLTLFLARDLAIDPGLLGMLYAIGGVSSLAGASVAERVVARFGPGPTLVVCLLLTNLSLLFVPLATGPLLAVALFVGAQQLFDGPAVIFEIGESSVIQAVAPERLIGRVVAAHGFVQSSAMLAGTVLGGVLGEWIGARGAMFVGGLGTLLAVGFLALSPVRTLRTLAPAA